MKWEPRKVDKSPEEKALDEAMADYERHFGKPFVFDFAAHSEALTEMVAAIRRMITENKEQAAPEYEKGDVY